MDKGTMINYCFSSGLNEQTYAHVRNQKNKNKALKINRYTYIYYYYLGIPQQRD